MKPIWNKKYATICLYTFFTAAAIILFYFAVKNHIQLLSTVGKIIGTLRSVIYGLIIAYLLAPLERSLNRLLLRIPGKRGGKTSKKVCGICSIVLTYVLFLAVVTGFFFLAVPAIGQSIKNISDNFQTYYERALRYIDEMHLPFLEFPRVSEELDKLLEYALNFIRGILPTLSSYLLNLATGIMNFVVRLFIGILISIYVLYGRVKMKNGAKRILQALFGKKKTERVLRFFAEADSTFGGFIRGKLLDSVIVGIICFIAMSLLRMPNVALISVLVGVTNIIPMFGPLIGAVPSALLILLSAPSKTIWFIILIVVLQQLDGNLIGPKILGETTGLPAFWVIFSLLLFGGMFGVVGMLIAVPVFALIYNAVDRLVDRRLQKNMPVEALEGPDPPPGAPPSGDSDVDETETDCKDGGKPEPNKKTKK